MTTLQTISGAAGARSAIRLGFLGLGWIGRHRCGCLLRDAGIDAVAICDDDAAAVEAAAPLVKGARVVSSLETMLDCDLDGVVIATPSALHAEAGITALRAGCAVYCQKPLGRTAAETHAVVEAARRANRLLGCDFCYRHVAGVPDMRRRIQAGDIGDVYAAHFVFHNAYGPDKLWYYDRVLSGGGCLMDLGIHLVDLLHWLFPEARPMRTTCRIHAGGLPWSPLGKKVEDYAAALVELHNGVTATLSCSWKLPIGRDCEIEASVYGTRGALSLQNVGGSFYDFRLRHFQGTQATVLTEPPDDWGGRSIVRWARRLEADRRFDHEQAALFLRDAELLDSLYAAGASTTSDVAGKGKSMP